MSLLNTVAKILAGIGAINWGLVAVNESYNLVEMLLGTGMVADVVYYLVGLSGAYLLVLVAKKLMK
ncbi:MAG: DUF378 domain-containing protein [Candidatus Spechtbacterales bacterium]